MRSVQALLPHRVAALIPGLSGVPPRRRREYLTFLAFIAPNFILFGVFTFWPLVYSFYLSLHKWNMIAPTKKFVGLNNYAKMIQDDVFWQVSRNTLYLAGGTVFVKLALALGLALLLNQRLTGRSVYRAIIFSPTFTTSVAVAMVWSWIFDPFYGLLRVPLNLVGLSSPHWLSDVRWTMPAIIIVSIWSGMGYDMVIFLAGLQGIPRDLYEAAHVDGASGWRLFWNITFPLLSPTTFFLLVTSIIGAFKAFDIVAVMTGGGPMNSSNVYVYYLYQNAFRWFKTGYASALAVVFFIVILLITVFQVRLSRRWVHY
ncbi:MAG: sugar ABC transporter permease [Chloroflexi bacterium]|nr:sugar ABC transporter permease [Chloroflexota bacterium]